MTEKKKLGYDDTPVIPGSSWRVHDGARPQPQAIVPGEAGGPPSDAVVLFDGTDLSGWESVKGGPALWKVENGYMEVVPQSGSIKTKATFGDCQLHLEWAAPEVIEGEGQGRGNSGVFLMGIYEIQVLDSYENPTYSDGVAGAIYGQRPPMVNPIRKPGEWQTYDVVWYAPRFEGDLLIRPPFVTVFFNGVLIHHNYQLIAPTGHKNVPAWNPHPPVGPLQLQDHRNPVRFRNIWYRPIPVS